MKGGRKNGERNRIYKYSGYSHMLGVHQFSKSVTLLTALFTLSAMNFATQSSPPILNEIRCQNHKSHSLRIIITLICHLPLYLDAQQGYLAKKPPSTDFFEAKQTKLIVRFLTQDSQLAEYYS